jgi:lactate dehydrogenase-like 2-hydroxyacid dehydrogenase
MIAVILNEPWEEAHFRAAWSDETLLTYPPGTPAAAVASNTSACSVFIHTRVTAADMDRLPNLRLIATRSTGYDHIDLAAARARHIAVCNVPAYGERTVAEYAMALLRRHAAGSTQHLPATARFFQGCGKDYVASTSTAKPSELWGQGVSGATLGA